MPSPTTPTTTSLTPSKPAFPTPQTFNILPQIYDLITRLPPSLPPTTTTTTTSAMTTHLATSSPLDPKDLPQAAVPIKLKIQRARAAVSALPDVGRTIEEQEDEIQELEGRIERLRGVVGKLDKRAGAGVRKRRVMEGIEQSKGTV